jgi:hypothetical protein
VTGLAQAVGRRWMGLQWASLGGIRALTPIGSWKAACKGPVTIRVMVQLVNAVGGFHPWSESPSRLSFRGITALRSVGNPMVSQTLLIPAVRLQPLDHVALHAAGLLPREKEPAARSLPKLLGLPVSHHHALGGVVSRTE